jgi:hypothetical protein
MYDQGHHPHDRDALNATLEAHAPMYDRKALREQYVTEFRRAWDDAKQNGEPEHRLNGRARFAANTWLRGVLGINHLVIPQR